MSVLEVNDWGYRLSGKRRKRLLFGAVLFILLVIGWFWTSEPPAIPLKAEQQENCAERPGWQEDQLRRGQAAVVSVKRIPERPLRPVPGAICLAYGWQIHPVFGDWRYHHGSDFLAREGEPIQAMWSGRISRIIRDKHNGLTVTVTSENKEVNYGSLLNTTLAIGRQIKQGDIMGTVGSSPDEPYPHLHLDIKVDGLFRDPEEWL